MNKFLLFILTCLILFWSSHSFASSVCKTDNNAEIKWDSDSVAYYVNTSGGPSGALSAIQSAMETWTDVVTSDFTFVYGGTTSSTAHGQNDGTNIITFGPMGLNGVLGENYYFYIPVTGHMVSSDIKFNTDYPLSVSGSSNAYDVQNLGTHEFGHSLCLADLYGSSDSIKTMYNYVSPGETKKRTLDADDINGIAYLYPSSCTYSINPKIDSFTQGGGTKSAGITAPDGCNWSATSNASWITITSASSGRGDGTLQYSVVVNSSMNSRTGTMTIAGQTFTVSQEGNPCTYSIYPTSKSFDANGSTGNVNVSAPSGCNWSATSTVGWISIRSGSSGSGNGTMCYSITSNLSTSTRTGTITIAGKTFTLTQSGNYMPSPVGQHSFQYPPSEFSLISIDPSQAKPIGVGCVATGENFINLHVGLGQFKEPIDIYFALYLPSLDPNIYLLTSDNTLQLLDSGIVRWKENVSNAIDEYVVRDIPVSLLPSGVYYFGLLATPAGGSLDGSFYLWLTYFEKM